MKYCNFISVKKKSLSPASSIVCAASCFKLPDTLMKIYMHLLIFGLKTYADLLPCKELAGLLMLMSVIHYAELMDVHSTTQQAGVGITVNDRLDQKVV